MGGVVRWGKSAVIAALLATNTSSSAALDDEIDIETFLRDWLAAMPPPEVHAAAQIETSLVAMQAAGALDRKPLVHLSYAEAGTFSAYRAYDGSIYYLNRAEVDQLGHDLYGRYRVVEPMPTLDQQREIERKHKSPRSRAHVPRSYIPAPRG